MLDWEFSNSERRCHVKKLLVVFGFAAISAMAADWTGYIIDKNCASKKEMWGNVLAPRAASSAVRRPFW